MPICGGSWNNQSNAGVFKLNLNNPRTNRNWNIGFRSALPSLCAFAWTSRSPDRRGSKGVGSLAYMQRSKAACLIRGEEE